MKKTQLTVRGLILGDGTPKICVPLTAADREELERQVDRIMEGPFDLTEWRADFYRQTDDELWVEHALAFLRGRLGDRPILFTFRTKEEGGERSIAMEEYETLSERAAGSGSADLVDIELNRGEERLRRMAERIHAHGGKLVASFHDFAGTPSAEKIAILLTKMQELGADITKAAVMPQSEEDVLALLDASVLMKRQYADRPYITMAMGRLGAVSRLCGALTGSAVTFATAGKASAPGQLDADLVARLIPLLQI